MNDTVHSPEDLQQIYRARFTGKSVYRRKVWSALCSFFSQWVSPNDTVLDLGAGYCEFINTITSGKKFAMDLNLEAKEMANSDVTVIHQDCSQPWHLPATSLDVVFTSNFFEHLPSKAALERTLNEAFHALKPGGRLIAMGPNIKAIPGEYWDFFDHYLPLTELSLAEVCKNCGFAIDTCWARFLPYTMSSGREYPIAARRAYLAMPFAWRWCGKQFLVICKKPS